MSICPPSLFFGLKRIRRLTLLNITMCLLALNTTACHFDFFSSNDRAPKAMPPKPIQTAVSYDEASDLALPATSADGFGDAPQINIERGNLKGALTLNDTLLFEENISNEGKRFDRVEDIVQRISDKMNKMEPTVDRLARVEQDLEGLTEQLEVLVNQETITMRQHGSYDSSAKVEGVVPIADAAQQQNIGNVPFAGNMTFATDASLRNIVQGIRTADHKTKTRIVLETNELMHYITAINNNKFTFTVAYYGNVPQMDLNSLTNSSKEIVSVMAQQNGPEATITFQLSDPTVLMKEGRIHPNKDNAQHRIYLDIKR